MAVIQVDAQSVTLSTGYGWLPGPAPFALPQAGSPEQIEVTILNSSLVAQFQVPVVTLSAHLYYNFVGDWTLVTRYTDALWAMMQSGDFFVEVNWKGLFKFGGKCEQPGYSDSLPGSTGASFMPGPFIMLNGADYLGLIANRIAFPNPTVAWTSQTAAASDAVSNTPLETAIKYYVNRNIGPGAIAARQLDVLDIGTNLVRGANVNYTVKFGTGVDLNLLDVIRALIAQTNTAMGVQVTRNGQRLTFDCYVPRDLRGLAWFSEDLGNLTAIQLYLTDPTLTDSLVQGSTSFIQMLAAGRTKWNRIEQFLDSSSETDANILQTNAQQALLQGGVGPLLSATTTDTPYITFGRDYGLGDIVTIEVRPGVTYQDVISSVTMNVDPSQHPSVTVVPTIGNSSSATATDQKIIGQLSARIRTLEKKLANK